MWYIIHIFICCVIITVLICVRDSHLFILPVIPLISDLQTQHFLHAFHCTARIMWYTKKVLLNKHSDYFFSGGTSKEFDSEH